MYLSDRIRSARMAAGLTQHQLALLVGVSRGAVANWERVGTAPRSEKLRLAALATQVSFEWLATGRGPRIVDSELRTCSIPTAYAEFVEDELELRLIRVFRLCGTSQREMLVELLESRV